MHRHTLVLRAATFALMGSTFALGGCSGAPADDTSSTTNQDDALTVDAQGFVLVPGGRKMHQSCVVKLEDGDTVEDEGVVRRADGTLDQHTCDFEPRPVAMENAASTAINGWVEAAHWKAPSEVHTLGGFWVVPPAPASQGSQTIFYFTGTEDAKGSVILQPVLQWGGSAAGGGKYFAIASWYVGNKFSHFSALKRVPSGHTIRGWQNGGGAGGKWTVSTTDWTANVTTTLNVSGVPKQTEAFAAVLEAYGVTACNQFPSTARYFSTLSVFDLNNKQLSPKWANDWVGSAPKTPACSYGVRVVDRTAVVLSY